MRKQSRRIPAAALAASLVLGLGSATALAAWRYLAPEQVAETVEDKKLQQAFSGEDAIAVNETQTFGKYQVTLLGIVSGKGISDYITETDGELKADRTYAVTAIEHTDGTPMALTSEDAYGEETFFVSPYIKGYAPAFYNAFTLSGGYTDFVEDGILYRLSECDNVELFADKGVYLGVSDGSFYNADAYIFDEASGEIQRNETYEGLNALFELPLDTDKADPAAAEEYIQGLEETSTEEAETTEEMSDTDIEVENWMNQLTPENINEKATPLEATRTVLTPDAEGNISYAYEIGKSGGEGSVNMEDLFTDNTPGMSGQFSYSYGEGGLDSLYIETFTLNEDGTVTFMIYVPKK